MIEVYACSLNYEICFLASVTKINAVELEFETKIFNNPTFKTELNSLEFKVIKTFLLKLVTKHAYSTKVVLFSKYPTKDMESSKCLEKLIMNPS